MTRRRIIGIALLGASLGIYGLSRTFPGSHFFALLRLLKWLPAVVFLLVELVAVLWVFRLIFSETTQESEMRITRELRWIPGAPTRSLLFAEMRVWLYGLKPRRLTGWKGQLFTYARQGDNAKMQKIFLYLMCIELPIAHLFLRLWLTPMARWIVTLLSAYVALWMYAEFRTTTMRPVSLDGDLLQIRYGILHTYEIPVAVIQSVARVGVLEAGAYDLKLVGFGAPNVGLTLKMPTRTLFGRRVTSIALAVDEPAQLFDVLRQALARAEVARNGHLCPPEHAGFV
ncbi:MAG: hypothetical protein B7X39_09925 [Lysobacterales bacterium 14-68-21]|jgi:hypothetical protein|nr:MAG: hypothetical protein B7X45_09015 [Xanthomonadales bacterium 15-68-25]OZB66436.1 MAG: hypothetical protein B7X39_09925 [Xanthomonadales bacterium 14-68-21]